MLQVVKTSFHNVFFSQNIFSFILCSFLISKVYDYVPTIYAALSKKSGLANQFISATEDVEEEHSGTEQCRNVQKKYFGRFRLPIAKSVFFRTTRASCLNHKEEFCGNKDCLKKNLGYLFDLIRAAEREILLCCYTFTLPNLAEVILEAHDRNVDVRVVTNFESASGSIDSEVRSLSEKGIRIKMEQSTFIFHHKFIILDQTVLINGSTNFTPAGLLSNTDGLLVTSDPIFVENYTEEFNHLWNNFKLTY